MTTRPSFQFYPADWRKESGLLLCSMAARGLWVEMLCLMHEGEPYGHLTYRGKSLPTAALARLIGESPAAVQRWYNELHENEVFSLTDDGVPYSRRMVRDEAVREKRAAGGEAGKEHGVKGASHGFKGGRPPSDKTPLNGQVRGDIEAKTEPPLKPPPSSSSSSASSERTASSNEDVSAEPTAKPLSKREVMEAWQERMVPLGFPRIAKMTGDRERKLNARLKDSSLEEWLRVFDALERSNFCRGENDRGWKADFDFLLSPKSFTGLLEGKYDH